MTGYVEVNINGLKYGLKFGLTAIKSFAIAMETKQAQYYEGDNMTFLGMAKLIQCGHWNQCEIMEVEPTLKLEEIHNWVENAVMQKDTGTQEMIGKALAAFADSQYVKGIVEQSKEVETDEEPAKKKTPKSGLKKSKARS